MDPKHINNAVLKRLIDEVRHATPPAAYNRLHNRHNRSRVQNPPPPPVPQPPTQPQNPSTT